MTKRRRLSTGIGMRRHWSALTVGAIAIACTTPTVQRLPSPSPTAPAASPAAPPAVRRPVPTLTANAIVRDLAGGRAGTATFTDSYSGVIVAGVVSGIGLGAHAVHIHEVGKCEPPFASAGAHFNPERRHHGFRNPDGPHLGDLPIIDMPAAGTLRFEFLLPGVTLKGANALLGGNGTSIVIHTTRDDYTTDPSGNSGARLACGVIVG